MDNQPITITTTVKAPIEKVWEFWNAPQHISGWAFASEDWEAPHAENDLRTGGIFKTRMQAKANPSEGFDFNGVYTQVIKDELIEYNMEKAPQEEKARHVKIEFEETPEGIKITQAFDPENENSIDMQKQGWQAILNNFKIYTEAR